MRKRILFVALSLKTGGIERALVEQLNNIDYKKYDVDLFLFSKIGAYLADLSPSVNCLKCSKLLSFVGLTRLEAKRDCLTYLIRILLVLLAKSLGSKLLYRFIFLFIKPLSGYNYAISYVHNVNDRSLYFGCNEFVLRCVNSCYKFAWIHSDYNLSGMNSKYNKKIYQQFDGVINVSLAMKHKFDLLGVVSTNKSNVVYNRMDYQMILSKSQKYNIPKQRVFSIITVGRIEKMKGVEDLLNVAKSLTLKGYTFFGIFVGDGVMYKWAKKYIQLYQMNSHVELIGNLNNPYPYVKSSDLYVSGSYSETFGLAIAEALFLNVPVVAYRNDSITELLDGSNGIICETFESVENCICELINDRQKYNLLKRNTGLLQDYNECNSKQFERLLDRFN